MPNKSPTTLLKKTREEWIETARTLAEALPYIQTFKEHTFVIKFGGSAMTEPSLTKTFAHDLMLLKEIGINPVVIHGGGPQIGSTLEKLGMKSNFYKGLRITDESTIKIVEKVLVEEINKSIVEAINEAGGNALGLSGKSRRLIEAEKIILNSQDLDSDSGEIVDLGYVGEPTKINSEALGSFASTEIIPVISPIGIGVNDETYNINADTAAGAIASAVNASKFILLTDVEGVLNKEDQLVKQLTLKTATNMLNDGSLSGGMIPKIETCAKAINEGAMAVHILDGRIPHVLLLELFTDHGVGTMINNSSDYPTI